MWLVFCFLCLFAMKFFICAICKISIYTIRFGLRLFYKVLLGSYKDTIWLLWTHSWSSTTLCSCTLQLCVLASSSGSFCKEQCEVSTIEIESSVSPNSNQPTHHPNQYKQNSRSYICTANSMLQKKPWPMTKKKRKQLWISKGN
jgi:hypothetical protein